MLPTQHPDDNRQITPAAVATSFAPPPQRAACTGCGVELPRDARWCPECRRSAVPHIPGKLASLEKRFVAHLIDMAVPSVGTAMVASFAINRSMPLAHVARAIALVAWGVWSMYLFSSGMSLGKWLLKIYVINEEGDPPGFWRMVLREWIGKTISLMVFCLGFLSIATDKENRGWHDKIADTHVVED
jgi:uncharacterized RDD family membrane protein YckC